MTKALRSSLNALAVSLLALSAAGCARWKPESNGGPIELTRACPFKRAPAVADYGAAGVSAMYHFVVQDAPKKEIAAFGANMRSRGFAVLMMMMNVNGKDTLFVRGAKTLQNQAQVDNEFDVACGAGSEHVYLTNVLHKPFDPTDPNPTRTRVR